MPNYQNSQVCCFLIITDAFWTTLSRVNNNGEKRIKTEERVSQKLISHLIRNKTNKIEKRAHVRIQRCRSQLRLHMLKTERCDFR